MVVAGTTLALMALATYALTAWVVGYLVLSVMEKSTALFPTNSAPKLVRASAAFVAPVPPLAIGNIPVTPVVSGKPVALVKL